MNEIYTEKEILGDALNTEKNATNLYNLGANECVHDNLRETMLNLLSKEHEIQVDVLIRCSLWNFVLHLPQKARKFRKQKPNLNVDIKPSNFY